MPIRGSPNGPRHFSPHCSQPLAPRGHFGLERVVTIDWKQWSPSIGILRVELGRACVLPATGSGATQLKPR